jgi:hypothetical protein
MCHGVTENGVHTLLADWDTHTYLQLIHLSRLLSLLICSCVPQEQLPAAIQTLAEPLLNPIKGAMQQFTPSLGAGVETTLAPQLPLFDRLATLFDSLPAQHAPAASILLQVGVGHGRH